MSRGSLSTVLLVGAVACGLSLLIIATPWNATWGHSVLEHTRYVTGWSGPLLVVVMAVTAHWLRVRRNAGILEQARAIPSSVVLEVYPAGRDVSWYWLGDPAEVEDGEGPLELLPRALLAKTSSGLQRCVVVPASFWVRFSGDRAALAAVLAHERAHLQNRDVALLFGGARILTLCGLVGVSAFSLSFGVSVSNDLRISSTIGDTIIASLVGKALFVQFLGVLLILPRVLRRMVDWREALADAIAADEFGWDALERAERLIGRSRGGPPRPRSRQARTLTWADAAVAGFFVEAAASGFAGLVMFSTADRDSLTLAGRLLAPVLLFSLRVAGVAFAMWPVVAGGFTRDAQDRELLPVWQRPASSMGGLAFAVAVGAFLYACVNLLPTIANSMIELPDFEFQGRVIVGPHVILSLGRQALSLGVDVSMAAVVVAISQRRHSAWIGCAPAVVWCCASAAEYRLWPGLAHGMVAPLATTAILGLGFGFVWPPRRELRWIAVCIGVLGADLLGLGDISHLAACASEGARRDEDEGRIKRAISGYYSAVRLAPFSATAALDYVEALQRQAAREPDLSRADEVRREAVRISTEVGAAWWTTEFADRFRAHSLAGQSELELRSLADADRSLTAAVSLARSGNRFGADVLAIAYYNLACVKSLLGDELHSMAYLVTALELLPGLASHALGDDDLGSLRLHDPVNPSDRGIDCDRQFPHGEPVEIASELHPSTAEAEAFLSCLRRHVWARAQSVGG